MKLVDKKEMTELMSDSYNMIAIRINLLGDESREAEDIRPSNPAVNARYELA